MSTFLIFGGTAAVLYFWVAYKLGKRLSQGIASTEGKRLPIAVGMGGITLHGLMIYTTVLTENGLNFSFFNAISLITWLITTMVLVASIYKPVENLAIPVLPSAAIAILLAIFFPAENTIVSELRLGLDLHILISVLAFSILNIAAVQAVLLAIQNKHLRNRQPGGFIRALPPLETMERLLFQIIGLGFMLETLSLISGFAFLDDMFAQHMVHKTVFAVTAWGVFAILLVGRLRFGWRGRTAIRWTIGGFAALLLAYVGSKLVLELVLTK